MVSVTVLFLLVPHIHHPVVCLPFNAPIISLQWLCLSCPACTAQSPLLYYKRSAPCLDPFIPLSFSLHLANVSHYRFRSFHPPHKPFLFAASTDAIYFVESELLLSANSAVTYKHRNTVFCRSFENPYIHIMATSSSPPPPASCSSSESSPNHHSNHRSHEYHDANIRNFAPVARIMKGALPDNAKIAKEAKECMQECVSEFISFITSEGNYHFHRRLIVALTVNSI